jgi:hypothetical protein
VVTGSCGIKMFNAIIGKRKGDTYCDWVKHKLNKINGHEGTSVA